MTSGWGRLGHVHWRPGDAVVLRLVWRGRARNLIPATVVDDTEERVILYVAHGTVCLWPTRSRAAELADGAGWGHAERVWRGHALVFAPAGAAHAPTAVWDRDWAFRQWKINIQEPLRRTPVGFDTMDHILDVVVGPDLAWRWKDEELFEEAVGLGVYSAEEEAAIRQEGERAAEALVQRMPALAKRWEPWRPDPAWTVPVLPKGLFA